MSLILVITHEIEQSIDWFDSRESELVPSSTGQTASEGVNTWAWVSWRFEKCWGKWMWCGDNEVMHTGDLFKLELPRGLIGPTALPDCPACGEVTTEARDAPDSAFHVQGCGTVVPRRADLVLACGLLVSLVITAGLVASMINWKWILELVSVILSVSGWVLVITWFEFLREGGPFYGIMSNTVAVGLLFIWPSSWVTMAVSLLGVGPNQFLMSASLILHLTSTAMVFGRVTTGLPGRDEKRVKVSGNKVHATSASMWLANVVATAMEVETKITFSDESNERRETISVFSDHVEVAGKIDFHVNSDVIHKAAALVVIHNGKGRLSGVLTGYCFPSELIHANVTRPRDSNGVNEDFNALIVWDGRDDRQVFDLNPGGVVASHTGAYVVRGSFVALQGSTGLKIRTLDRAFAKLDYHYADGGKVVYAVLGLLGVLNTILSGAFLLVSSLGPLWWVVATNLVGEVIAIGVSMEAWLVGGGRLFTYCSDPIHASFDWSDGRFRYTLRVLMIEAFCAIVGMLILIGGGIWSEAVISVGIGFAAMFVTGTVTVLYRGSGALMVAYIAELMIEVTLPFAVDKISWAVVLVSASALLETIELMIVAERLIRARETRPGNISDLYHSVSVDEWAKSLTVSSGLYFAFFGDRFEPVHGRGIAIPVASRSSVVAELSTSSGSNANLHCEGVTYAGAVMTVALPGEATSFRTCSASQNHSGFCSAVALADRGVFYPLLGDKTSTLMNV